MIAGIIMFAAVFGIFIPWCLIAGGGRRDED